MGLKLLHSADWHLDSPLASFSTEEQEELRRSQRQIPFLLANVCRKEKCDLVLLAGDIFDSLHYTRESLDALRRGLELCGVPVLISPGNHDFCCPGSPWIAEQWPKNVYIFTSGLSYIDFPSLECRIYGAGFQSMDCPPLLDGFRAEKVSRYSIGLFHGDPVMKSSPYNPITAAQIQSSGLDYLALGHIHQSGAFEAGKTLCAWPGCPMGRGWDETGKKGFYLVSLDEKASLQTRLLNLPRFYNLEVDISKSNVSDFLPAIQTKDHYRVTLTGTGEINLDELYSKFRHIPYLTIIDRTERPVDVWEDAGQDSLRGTFFRLLQEEMEYSDSPEVYQLAAEISRRLLDGKEVTLP